MPSFELVDQGLPHPVQGGFDRIGLCIVLIYQYDLTLLDVHRPKEGDYHSYQYEYDDTDHNPARLVHFASFLPKEFAVFAFSRS